MPTCIAAIFEDLPSLYWLRWPAAFAVALVAVLAWVAAFNWLTGRRSNGR